MAATVPPSFGHAAAQKDGIARQRSMSAGDLPRLDTASAVARCRVRYAASGVRFHDVKLLPLRAASAREARAAAAAQAAEGAAGWCRRVLADGAGLPNKAEREQKTQAEAADLRAQMTRKLELAAERALRVRAGVLQKQAEQASAREQRTKRSRELRDEQARRQMRRMDALLAEPPPTAWGLSAPQKTRRRTARAKLPSQLPVPLATPLTPELQAEENRKARALKEAGAVRKLQSAWRAKARRMALASRQREQRRQRAALKVQALWRGFAARVECQRMLLAEQHSAQADREASQATAASAAVQKPDPVSPSNDGRSPVESWYRWLCVDPENDPQAVVVYAQEAAKQPAPKPWVLGDDGFFVHGETGRRQRHHPLASTLKPRVESLRQVTSSAPAAAGLVREKAASTVEENETSEASDDWLENLMPKRCDKTRGPHRAVPNTVGNDLKQFMKERGLEPWHSHLTKHLGLKTPADLIKMTADDLKRMAVSANMKLDKQTTEQVLAAVKRNPKPATERQGSGSPQLKEYMADRGLEAWHGCLTKHLDLKTPADLIKMSADDLRKMARAANMSLDQETIDQVLAAAGRDPSPAQPQSQSGAGGSNWRQQEQVIDAEALGVDAATARLLRELQFREVSPEDYELLGRLDEQVEKPKSRLCSTAQVERFPLITVGQGCTVGKIEADTECGVCLCPMEKGEQARRLPCCSHAVFHDDCIMQWLTEQKNTCPACMHEYARE